MNPDNPHIIQPVTEGFTPPPPAPITPVVTSAPLTPPAPEAAPAPPPPSPEINHSFNDSHINATPFEPTTPNGLPSSAPTSDQPVPIVKAYSVRGVEYGMMTLTLWFGAGALLWIFISMINGGTGFSLLAFPIALLLVTVPVFAFFFLRLKKSELANPALRFDASKRRFSQVTQFVAFAVCLVNIIAFVYLVLSSFASSNPYSVGKATGDLFIVLVIVGGILAYYWFDEHRLIR